MMKIGIFTNIYLPGVSGVITAIENYRKELEKQGHQVFIFAPECGFYQDKNSKVFRFRSVDLHYKMSYPLPIAPSSRIGRKIKQLKLDIIHTQHFFACGQLAWYYAKKLNTPLVFTYHTRYDLYTDYLPVFPKEISVPFIQLFCAFYADACDGVIAPSRDVKELLLKYKVKTPITVLPSGIDLEKFSRRDSQIMRAKYNLSKDNILLLTVSRLGPEKNLLFLLKAFQKIESAYPEARFMLVGEGPSKKDLEAQSAKMGLKEKVIFTGEIPNEKIPSFYSCADIFIFSSTSETQGLVVLEAMASGLPVVAVEANGVKDMIENKKNGFLCSQNIYEFSKTILRLIKNPDLRKKVSENAIKTVQNYSVEKSAKKLVEFYKKVQKQEQKKKEIADFLKFKSDYFDQIFKR